MTEAEYREALECIRQERDGMADKLRETLEGAQQSYDDPNTSDYGRAIAIITQLVSLSEYLIDQRRDIALEATRPLLAAIEEISGAVMFGQKYSLLEARVLGRSRPALSDAAEATCVACFRLLKEASDSDTAANIVAELATRSKHFSKAPPTASRIKEWHRRYGRRHGPLIDELHKVMELIKRAETDPKMIATLLFWPGALEPVRLK